MKKIFSTLFILFFSFSLFANNDFSVIYSESFDCQSVHDIEANLLFENITVKKYTGEEILIELESNNSLLKPNISINSNKILKIQNKRDRKSDADYCNIIIYLPVNFQSTDLIIKTESGNISLTKIRVLEDIELVSFSGDINIDSVSCDYHHCVSNKGNILSNMVSCSYFFLDNTDGKIEVVFSKDPTENCKITNKNSDIILKHNFISDLTLDIQDAKKIIKNSKVLSQRTGLISLNDKKNAEIADEQVLYISTANGSVFIN